MADYESVVCVKNEVYVYNIPPRPSNRGYRAADWTLDKPDYTLRLRAVAKGSDLTIKLEDRNTGELFAKCPVDAHPGVAVEAVMDSSRYFVIRLMDDSGKHAFVGIGFGDRSDSFDLNVALQDHFKWVQKEKDIASQAQAFNSGPQLDLGFKEGQTIKINIAHKDTGSSKPKARPAASGGGLGLLPPPPPGGKILLPPPGSKPAATAPAPQQQPQSSKPAPTNNWVTFD